MNPRVSRSSALASKATGFPIAKIAARLAVGYTLDEIPNDITKMTPASFEPTIDYIVTKIPRWAFEKLPGTSGILGTQMQSVGEAMAIGRTFTESLQKALRSLEQGRLGLNCDPAEEQFAALSDDELLDRLAIPTPDRLFQVGEALRAGHHGGDGPRRAAGIDPWFLDQMLMIVEERAALAVHAGPQTVSRAELAAGQAARLLRRSARLPVAAPTSSTCAPARRTARRVPDVQDGRHLRGRVRGRDAVPLLDLRGRRARSPVDRPKVVILGSGPNRIGQGIEFDYCCVHASFALRDAGYETVMVNCNPETVSTDYDTSDRLYFEPLTREDVLNVIAAETASSGGVAPKVIVSLGGQTPLKLAGLLPVELIAGTVPGLDRPRRGPREVERAVRSAAHPAAARRHRGRPRRSEALIVDDGSVSRCSSARATCSVGGRCRSSTTAATSPGRWPSSPGSAASARKAGCRPSGRCSSTASWRTRSRSTSTRSATTPARC